MHPEFDKMHLNGPLATETGAHGPINTFKTRKALLQLVVCPLGVMQKP